MNKKLAIIAAVLVIGVIGVIVILNSNNTNKPAPTSSSGMDKHTKSDSDSAAQQSNADSQQTNEITYKGFAVVQKSITVKKGTTVTWTNQDDADHDVTPDTETADFKTTELFGKGESKKITFNTVGTYPYHCSPHPYMKGTIKVVE